MQSEIQPNRSCGEASFFEGDACLVTVPRLGLVCDSPIGREGFGLARTLANIFLHYPAERLFSLVPQDSFRNESYWGEVSTFNPEPFRMFRNRLGNYLNGFIEWVNLTVLAGCDKGWSPKVDTLLICGSYLSTLVTGHREAKRLGVPYIVYLMDDLRAIERKSWLQNSGRSFMQSLLEEAAGWIMISQELQSEYTSRFKITPQASIILHNAVPTASFKWTPYPHDEGLSLAYAGSLWGMHFDAVEMLAHSISELRREGAKITFTIYTSEECWSAVGSKLGSSAVQFGGSLPYHELHSNLARHHLLVSCSSFSKDYSHLSRTSVQTKLTDYMASGRAILSFGPLNSACHSFVEKWGCGYVCNYSENSLIKNFLRGLSELHQEHECRGRIGFDVANDNFTTERVSTQAFRFIAQVAERGVIIP